MPCKTSNSSPSTSEKKSITLGAFMLFKIEFKFCTLTFILIRFLILSFVDLVLSRDLFSSSFK